MAGAQAGIFHFQGKSGQTYDVSAYWDDNVGRPVRFSQAGVATGYTPTEFFPPEDVVLTDIILGAATTNFYTQLMKNGAPTGDIIQQAVHLAAVNTRPALRVLYKKGESCGAMQLA